MTIHGITRTIGGQTSATASHENAAPAGGRLFDNVLRLSRDFTSITGGLYSDSYAQTTINSYLSDYLSDGSYATPFTYTATSADGYFSNVHFNIKDFATGTQLVNVYLSLAPGTASSRVGGIPEPLSWVMMVAGFGLMGGAMRYRRQTARVSFG